MIRKGNEITQGFFNTFFAVARMLFHLKIKPDGSLNIDLHQVLAVTKTIGDALVDTCNNLLKTDLTNEEKVSVIIKSASIMDFLQQIKDIACMSSIQFRTMSDEEITWSLAPIPKKTLEQLPDNAVVVDPRKFQSMFLSGLKAYKKTTTKNWTGEFDVDDVHKVVLKCLKELEGLKAPNVADYIRAVIWIDDFYLYGN